MKNWTILYRGSLSSCNYSCTYCPFAKTKNTREELALDAQQLRRFSDWVQQREENIRILFTPWGEGLIRPHYQKALIELGHAKHVQKVAIQTNLSCSLNWIEACNRESVALWTTFHPSQTTVEQFLNQCERLLSAGIQFSVGTVGLKEDAEIIQELRNRLPKSVYLWINAYKRVEDYYNEDLLTRFEEIDPHFPINNKVYDSLGKPCNAGHTAFSVDEHGDMTRCHFIDQKIGNIYDANFEQALQPRNCSNTSCRCHIGFMHLQELKLNEVFQGKELERIAPGY